MATKKKLENDLKKKEVMNQERDRDFSSKRAKLKK